MLWSLTLKVKYKTGFMPPQLVIVLVFAVCFIIGMTFAFCFGKNDMDAEAEWLESIMLYLQYGTVYYNDLTFYVVKKRISIAFILFLVCLTSYAAYILLFGIGIFGFIIGYLVSKYIIWKGIIGSIFFGISLLPHYLCYIYGYLKLLDYMRKKNSEEKCINQRGQSKHSYEWKKVIPIVVVIIGLLIECYVNPFFVKIFLKIFM